MEGRNRVAVGLAAASLAGMGSRRLVPAQHRVEPTPPSSPAKNRRPGRYRKIKVRRGGTAGQRIKPWFKGSAHAKRATKRGGNPARSQLPRPVRHRWSQFTHVCTMCRFTRMKAANLRGSDRRVRYCQ